MDEKIISENFSTDYTVSSDTSVQCSIRNIIINIGENPDREGLKNTPERYAKSITYLTSGYNKNLDEVIGNGIFTEDVNEDIITVKDIDMYSLCEHHLLPFFGKVEISYTPNKKILGLSKFSKIVEMYSRRLQTQERLTKQIAEAIMQTTVAKSVSVKIEAQHLCMMMRGVEKSNSKTITRCVI